MSRVIINADDYGLTESCTKAIWEAFQKKIITDTTMVANGEAFDTAVEMARDNGILHNIGVHFNLTEGVPLTDNIKKCGMFVENGKFIGKVNRLKPLNGFEKQAVYDELTAQVNKIIAAGITPTHADSHHHIHTGIFIAPIVIGVCREHGIKKIRLHRNIGSISKFKMLVKDIYNNRLKKSGFITTRFFGSLDDISSGIPNGTVELMVHPDYDSNGVMVDRIEYGEQGAIGTALDTSFVYCDGDGFCYNSL